MERQSACSWRLPSSSACSFFGSTRSRRRATAPIPVWPPISRRRRRSFPTCRHDRSRSTTRRRLPSKSEVAPSSRGRPHLLPPAHPRRPTHSLRPAYRPRPRHSRRVTHSLRPSLLPQPPQASTEHTVESEKADAVAAPPRRRESSTVRRGRRRIRDTAAAAPSSARPARVAPPPLRRHSGARALAREPGIHNHGLGLWIPGSRLWRAPE